MGKKPASFEYNGTLVKVLDGDTIDCYIDLGFDLKIKIVSHGTGKFGRVLGEIFVSPDAVGHEIAEGVDRSSDGLVSINDILINEGHAYEYSGGKKKDFKAEIAKEKAAKKKDLVDKPAEEAWTYLLSTVLNETTNQMLSVWEMS